MNEPTDREPAGKQALVTGATGFIGQHLCSILVSRGYRVRALLRHAASAKSISRDDGIEVCRAELCDSESLESACKGANSVFHLASIAHAGEPDQQELQKVIVEGTAAVVEAARTNGVENFIYFSSSHAVGLDAGNGVCVSAYARHKKVAEDSSLAMADDGFRVSVMRPANVYGPGMKGNMAGLIRRIRAGLLPPLPRLRNTFPMVSVQDVCEAAILAAEHSPGNGQIYPVSDGQLYTPNDLEAAIYEALGRKKPGWHSPRMVFYAASLGAQIANDLGIRNNDLGLRTYRNLTGQTPGGPVSNKKLTTELGFQPGRTFTDELPTILESL